MEDARNEIGEGYAKMKSEFGVRVPDASSGKLTKPKGKGKRETRLSSGGSGGKKGGKLKGRDTTPVKQKDSC